MARRVLFVDTETTGFPKCFSAGIRMKGNWPDVIQLGYSTSDSDEIVCEYLTPSQPVTEGSIKKHGITEEFLKEHGKDPRDVFRRFLRVCADYDVVVAHNIRFDVPVILAQLHRLGINGEPLVQMDKYCTVLNSCQIVKAKPKNEHGKIVYKYPNLQECAAHYRIFPTGDWHDARTDVEVLKKVYTAIHSPIELDF